MVLDRRDGHPVDGAEVVIYSADDTHSKITSIFSDKRGIVDIPKSLKRYRLELIYNGDRLGLSDIIEKRDGVERRRAEIELSPI